MIVLMSSEKKDIVEEKQELCSVIRTYGIRKGKYCNEPLTNGSCPYHPTKIDSQPVCSYVKADGKQCNFKVLQYDSVWCTRHINREEEKQSNPAPEPQTFPKLSRVGHYLIIRETNFVLSDDGLSIIGEIELVNGRFNVKKIMTEKMRKVSIIHNLKIQLHSDEN